MSQEINKSDWFENILITFKKKTTDLIKSFDQKSSKLIEIASFLAIGFFSGLLLKKYFKNTLLLILAIIFFIILSNYYDLININWNRLHLITGISGNDSIASVLEHFTKYFKNNMATSLTLLIGFIIGYKIG